MNPQVISSLDHPSVQPYRTLRRSEDHIRKRIFVAEGEKVVRRLLASSLEIVSFLLTPDWLERLGAEESRFAQCKVPVFTATADVLNGIVGYRLHQGIMAVGKVPPDPSLEEIVRCGHPPLLVALDGLMNAENVGVVVRNCAGFGADAILAGETSSSPYLRRSVRNSMGTVFQLPILHCADLVSRLKQLKDLGVRVVGAHLAGSTPLSKADLTGPVCIVFGNEESGLSDSVRDLSDILVAIPMHNQTDSLNVASAAAVFLYEASRQ
jgi:tRNA G18 (ribose-2'-O)-methylase SpoU